MDYTENYVIVKDVDKYREATKEEIIEFVNLRSSLYF